VSRAWEGYARSKGIKTDESGLTADDVKELQQWMDEYD
jgi:hypothetical protein